MKKSKAKPEPKDLVVKKSQLTEKGIIQPFKKPPVNNDRCGINRDKNPCGDASEY